MSTPNLLNDDGTASIATCLMMSHFALRRDLRRFARALASGNFQPDVLCEEWKLYHVHLHGHHEAEDTGVFPAIAAQSSSVAATIEKLSADHRRIDPILERGDRAFEELRTSDVRVQASAVVRELVELLDPHLALEEAELIPFLRSAKEFPAPATEADAAMYAGGFAWAMQGIASDVLEKVSAMLPDAVLSKIPAARAELDARCERAWGPLVLGAARTPIPDV